MKIKDAKDYFENGVITSFDAVKNPMGEGWLLIANGNKKVSWTLQTALNINKVFSKLDTLVTEVESITGRVRSLRFTI